LEFDGKPGNDWDVCPIIALYRQALALHMKAVVGEGGKFLASPMEHITLYKTQSPRWLTQIVCQFIKTVRWESEFSALVHQLEALEPVSCAVHDALVDLLAATADSLAATWDQRLESGNRHRSQPDYSLA
jgi:hypothetical protein